MTKTKILCILGPTASGKSAMAVEVARRFDGEVISADSRQVYRGLDIGTGKITPAEMMGVKHHLLDVADPVGNRYSVSAWKESAEYAIDEIASNSKLPIICGGTGFYIEAIVDGTIFPDVPHDAELQNDLKEKTASELVKILASIDPKRAQSVDQKNKRRIIRAIEIARALGRVPGVVRLPRADREFLMIGIDMPDAELKERIRARLVERIDQGMIEEARELYARGLSYERMNELGLEYRYLAKFLMSESTDRPMSRADLIDLLVTKIWQYAKRQRTWFTRDPRIEWYSPKDREKIFKRVQKWLGR